MGSCCTTLAQSTSLTSVIMSEESSDTSAECLNESVSSTDDHQHIKPLTIKINSPCSSVDSPRIKQNQLGRTVTMINSPHLSRASSSMSIASVAVEDVRHF